MSCKVIENKIESISVFNLKEKKFIKCTHKLSFKVESNLKANYSIIIGNRTYNCNDSTEINHIRVFNYEDSKELSLNFSYQSGNKKYIVTKKFNIPFFLNMSNKRQNSFPSQLKNIEDNIESYTKDEVCGFIESLIN